MAWLGSPMTQTSLPGGASNCIRRYCCSSTSWNSSIEMKRKRARQRAASAASAPSAVTGRATIGARRGGNVGGRRRSAALGLGDGAQQALRLALRHDEGFGEQRLALGFPDNAEAGIEPRRARVIAQDRESERVKCVNGDTGGRVRDQLGKPRAHFAGGAA